MPASPAVQIRIDYERIARNAEAIGRRVGVPILAVVKADAYGLGAARVVEALAEVVAGFCVFSLGEAVEAGIWRRTGKETIVVGPAEGFTTEARRHGEEAAELYVAKHVRPGVCTVGQAAALRAARPVVCVDTGMQRFGCPPEELPAIVRAGGCEEAFTHAVRVEQAVKLAECASGLGLRLHAAATNLLGEPAAWLNAVRPGLALYRGAARISTRLVEARDSRGPAGYTGFITPRHGLILAGYSNGLAKGPCLINGAVRKILEVGMQSAFVELGPGDRVGDEVVLLGDGLTEEAVGREWGTTPHQALVRLSAAATMRA